MSRTRLDKARNKTGKASSKPGWHIERGPDGKPRRVYVNLRLAQTHKKIAALWHPTKNQALTPKDVTATSTRKVGGFALRGMSGRDRSTGLPCTALLVRTANLRRLAKEWHPQLNGDVVHAFKLRTATKGCLHCCGHKFSKRLPPSQAN